MMQRLDLEFLFSVARHRGLIHRRYGIVDPLTVPRILIDYDLGAGLDPMALPLLQESYVTGETRGRWKMLKRRYREAYETAGNVDDVSSTMSTT